MKQELSIHALVAKLIREEIKKLNLAVTISVTSERFAHGNAVKVTIWTPIDKADLQKVRDIAEKYEAGTTDAMTDGYDYYPNPENLPRVMFVTVKRVFAQYWEEE